MTGCPIRKSPGQGSFAPNRSLSQLVTSFFASESQGIHRLHLTFSLMPFILKEYTCYSLLLIVYLTSWFNLQSFCVSMSKIVALPRNAPEHAMLIQTNLVRPSITNLSIVRKVVDKPSAVEDLFFDDLDLAYARSSYIKNNSPLLDIVDFSLRFRRQSPKRSCSSRTFRYGYLVTT